MASAIQFFNEQVQFRPTSTVKLKSWIKTVIISEKKSPGEINYIFCSDAYLAALNQQYLQHDTLTDIITFDNSETADSIDGDIYISVERIRENALKFETSFESELHRVMVHGVLHLVGYTDKTELQKSAMRKKEDAYLSLRTF